MTAFYCDLDNTLIYSRRREIGGNLVGVEQYQGKEISFMTCDTVELLGRVCERMLFIPVTTRTPEQFQRIRFGKNAPEYALVCNGGILLHHGVSDDAWYRHSLSLVSPCSQAMAQAKKFLEMDKNRCMEVRFLHQLFLFTKSDNPPATVAALRGALRDEPVEIFALGAKIYVLPGGLSKAAATARLRQKLGITYAFAAGDSKMDTGMLRTADSAFAPQALALEEKLDDHIIPIPDERIFSEELLRLILTIGQRLS